MGWRVGLNISSLIGAAEAGDRSEAGAGDAVRRLADAVLGVEI